MREDKILKVYGYLHLWIFTAGILLLFLEAGGALTCRSGTRLLLLAVPAVIFREVSLRGKKIWSYLAASLLVLGLLWFLGGKGWERVCLLLGAVFFLILFFVQRISGNREAFFRPSYACLLAFALGYILSLAYGTKAVGNLFAVLAGIYWLLILWSRNREHFLDYCGDYENLHRFPKQRIAYGSRLMLVLLTVLTVGCMAVLPFLGIDRGVLAALELLRRFLAMLLSGERKSPETEELPEGEPGIQPGFFGGGEEPSPFLTALWEILEKVFTIAVILAIAGGICAFLYWLYKKYNSQAGENGDILESLKPSKREEKERLKKSRGSGRGFWQGRTPEARIRKAYRQKIIRKGKPFAAATPQELEDEAGLQKGKEREEFHSLYEKARYGNVSCTQEEAKRMKELERVDFS